MKESGEDSVRRDMHSKMTVRRLKKTRLIKNCDVTIILRKMESGAVIESERDRGAEGPKPIRYTIQMEVQQNWRCEDRQVRVTFDAWEFFENDGVKLRVAYSISVDYDLLRHLAVVPAHEHLKETCESYWVEGMSGVDCMLSVRMVQELSRDCGTNSHISRLGHLWWRLPGTPPLRRIPC